MRGVNGEMDSDKSNSQHEHSTIECDDDDENDNVDAHENNGSGLIDVERSQHSQNVTGMMASPTGIAAAASNESIHSALQTSTRSEAVLEESFRMIPVVAYDIPDRSMISTSVDDVDLQQIISLAIIVVTVSEENGQEDAATPLSSPTVSDSNPQSPCRQLQEFQLEYRDLESESRQQDIDYCMTIILIVSVLLLGLLYVAIILCWVVLACSYFASLNKTCNVPLKWHFWLATALLVWTMHRRWMFRLLQRWMFDPLGQTRLSALLCRRQFLCQLFRRMNGRLLGRCRCRVVAYNLAYTACAAFVLQWGVRCILIGNDDDGGGGGGKDGMLCRDTAPALYYSSAVFVFLSMAIWVTHVLGIIMPLFLWSLLYRRYGYTSSSSPSTSTSDSISEAIFLVVFGMGETATSPRAAVPSSCLDR